MLDALKLSPELISHIEDDIISVEKEMDDDAESIITNERYNYVSKVIEKCFVKKDKHRLTVSDKIDRIVTNRFLALPIFASSCSLSTISVSRPSEQKQRTGQ